MNENPPGLKEIEAAADRIGGIATRTPLVESPALSRLTGHDVYLKLECFQPIKVFKIRGAYNKISLLSQSRVVAASSGNHGIAVAAARGSSRRSARSSSRRQPSGRRWTP